MAFISEAQACLDWMVAQIPSARRRGKTKMQIVENAVRDQIERVLADDARRRKRRRRRNA